MYSNKENINILTALLVAYGVKNVVVCPGSRNAPLVHNFNECPDITCHPVTDERSAAFVALGIRLRTGECVAVCVTSGSALLNTLPGVAEASYQKQGIIVISADRPAEWIGQLDGQTMPQPGALGSFVAKSVNLPECKDDNERWHCRRLVCEAMIEHLWSSASVHINVPISEPLFEFSTPELPIVHAIETVAGDNEHDLAELLNKMTKAERPMIVIGQTARDAINDTTIKELRRNIVVLAEPLSADDPSPSLDDVFTEMGTDNGAYKPDFVLFIGSTTISKRLRLFLRSLDDDCVVVMQNSIPVLEDLTRHARYVLVCEPEHVLTKLTGMFDGNASEFFKHWNELLQTVGEKNASSIPATLEAKAVKAFEALMEKGNTVFYANSTAVRLAARYADHYVFCNRGLNGIEGSLSTAVGASLVTDENVYCVIGDLSFFYDQNALWNQHLRGNLRILLLNNNRGEIFSTLPGLSDSPARDYLVMGAHKNTAVGACHQYGLSRKMVSKAAELPAAIKWLVESKSNCPLLLEVMVVKS